MKLSSVTAAYLFEDGHAVLLFEKRVRLGKRDSQTIEYAEVWEKWTEARLVFKGRLVLHRYGAPAYLKLFRVASQVTVTVPSLESGSENTKKMGLYYGAMLFDIEGGNFSVPTFSQGPESDGVFHSICSNDYTYQPHIHESFEECIDKSRWGDALIADVHRVKVAVQPAAESVAA